MQKASGDTWNTLLSNIFVMLRNHLSKRNFSQGVVLHCQYNASVRANDSAGADACAHVPKNKRVRYLSRVGVAGSTARMHAG